MQLTRSQFADTVTAIKGATFMSLRLRTEPKMRKTNNPYFGRVEKVSQTNVTVGAIYQNSVNRQSEREGNEKAGDFEAMSLPWGQWLVPNKLITHKGKLYLRAQVNAHMVPDVTYEIDGKEATSEQLAELETFIQTRKPSARQKEQGNEKEVKPFTVAIENIEEVTESGATYTLV